MGQSITAKCTDFTQLSEILKRAKSDLSASEAHGVLCGQLSSGVKSDGYAWFGPIMGSLDEAYDFNDMFLKNCREILAQLAKDTEEHLNSSELDFALVLPEDDSSLEGRIVALRDWCRGFLSGFGLAEERPDQALTENTKEVLDDFTSIAQISAETSELESDEKDLAEVIEYVRMAVLLVYTEVNHQRQGV